MISSRDAFTYACQITIKVLCLQGPFRLSTETSGKSRRRGETVSGGRRESIGEEKRISEERAEVSRGVQANRITREIYWDLI